MAARNGRPRGNVFQHGTRWQVRVSAGTDPVTGERITLRDSVAIPAASTAAGREKAERESRREAERVLSKLLTVADSKRAARTKATVGRLLDEWISQHDVEPTTLMNYESQIKLYLKPQLDEVPLLLFAQDAGSRMEKLYSRLRKCSSLCDGKVTVRHLVAGEHECRRVKHKFPPGRPARDRMATHDCDRAGCVMIECPPHRCEPYSASSIRSLHAIMSGACAAAVRWGWLAFNPMPAVKAPMKKKPNPKPPRPDVMAKIIEAAFASSFERGVFVWATAVTGGRRGEMLALQVSDVDFRSKKVLIDDNWVRAKGLIAKTTKTHQMRAVSVDAATLDLLSERIDQMRTELKKLGKELRDDRWLFSAKVDYSRPRDPSAMTRWFTKLTKGIGHHTTLRELRHYSATELLTSGVDLRTVAGRLGHGDGTTTLRHYAAWVGAADVAAAELIGSTMPKRN